MGRKLGYRHDVLALANAMERHDGWICWLEV